MQPDSSPVPPGIIDVQTPSAGPATLFPLSAVPQLHSLPGAKAQIYLDFVGAPAQTWGGFNVPVTPAFDQDGDPTTFSSGELTAIQMAFSVVAEAYSPFNVDVTTVAPSSLVHKQNMEVVIGGNGAWSGGSYGGLSYTGSFVSAGLPNVSWIFSSNLGNDPHNIGQASAHEAGHEFGLNHQSVYSGTTLVQEYNPGNGATAPIMGYSYGAARGLWWYGTSDVSSTTIQDDMAVIASSTNGFGYRADPYGHATTSATALTVSANSLSASGVVDTTSQSDYFTFTLPAGPQLNASFSLTVAQYYPTLHGRLQLLSSTGTVLFDADNSNSLGQGITTTLGPGKYFLVVKSFGQYGDVGQYSLTGAFSSISTVVARNIFYNNSAFDGWDATANANDDAAIATDKQALLPGHTASFNNLTSYSRGINGVMIDIANLPATPTANDFTVAEGNTSDPTTWGPAPTPTILVRPGSGVGQSSRVELIWPDDSMVNAWLSVTVKSTANTGLATPDVFYFGNLVGCTLGSVVAGSFTVGPNDMTAIAGDLHTFLNPAAITDPNDTTRDGRVDATDEVIARFSSGQSLPQISPAAPAIEPATTPPIPAPGFTPQAPTPPELWPTDLVLGPRIRRRHLTS